MSNFTSESINKKLKEIDTYDEVCEHNAVYLELFDNMSNFILYLKYKIINLFC